jgi:hypothetical protein
MSFKKIMILINTICNNDNSIININSINSKSVHYILPFTQNWKILRKMYYFLTMTHLLDSIARITERHPVLITIMIKYIL